jgi:sulfide:quinone oxidoreductase
VEKFEVLIVGGGTGGITVAAQLERAGLTGIAIIEPAKDHFYQPLWTLVGAGICSLEESRRDMASVIPDGVRWIHDSVASFQPEASKVTCASGKEYSYDYLVVSPGIELLWDRIRGLPETLGNNGVSSNYLSELAPRTWEFIRDFQGGTALFTFPSTPVKCAGAPQKIMYLAEDYFRINQRRDKSKVIFASASKAIFGIQKYAVALNRIISNRGIETRFREDLIAVDGPAKKATFRNLDTGAESVIAFDFLHVTPPMAAPQFIRTSPLANAEGWVDVDKFTLVHNRYKNIFGLGDASSLPTSRTGAAIRKQAPVLVNHLLAARAGRTVEDRYNGYASCPLVTRYGRVILAEFDYDGNPCETFPFDQSKERYSMYLLKRYVLPLVYWFGMLKGRA